MDIAASIFRPKVGILNALKRVFLSKHRLVWLDHKDLNALLFYIGLSFYLHDKI